MNLRLYVPDDSLQKGTWKPPVVKVRSRPKLPDRAIPQSRNAPFSSWVVAVARPLYSEPTQALSVADASCALSIQANLKCYACGAGCS
jgi:hypothetical protein